MRRIVTALAAAYLLAVVAGFFWDVGDVRRHNIEAAAFIFVAVTLGSVITRRPDHRVPPPPTPFVATDLRWTGVPLLGFALVLYGSTLDGGLFADDFVLLEAAMQGRWTVWTEFFRPVIFVVWRGLSLVPGDVPLLLHASNILFHALNGLLVVTLGQRLGLSMWPALLAGVLFVASPLSVEAVAWPAGMQDVFMTTFVLAFLLTLTAPRLTKGSVVLGIGLVVAACLTKETGIAAVPLAGLVCAVTRAPRPRWLFAGASLATVVVVLIVRFAYLPLATTVLPASRYQLKELLVRPFATLVVPMRAAEITSLAWLPVVLVAIVVLLIAGSVSSWNRRTRLFHLALFGAVFVLVSVAPVSIAFFVSDDLLGSRYLYLASAGWTIALAAFLQAGGEGSKMLRGVAAALLLVCWTALAIAQIRLWTTAASERDAILAAAEQAVRSGCETSVVHGLPGTLAGVPLFINGFPEAMRQRVSAARFYVTAGPEEVDCRLVWNGSGFGTD